MNLINRWHGLRRLYREFPSQFWVLILAVFIDRLGGAMLFPFFTLYLTRRFGIGMTQVGLLFGVYSLTGLAGSVVGGALTDRLGRKGVLIFGLIASSLSAVLMGVVDRFEYFAAVILLVGLLAEAGGPAHQALVADLLPEDKRAAGFGMLRVVANLSVTIGPLIGGLLAGWSYLALFLADAGTSLLTAGLVFFTLRETWKPAEHGGPQESLTGTFRGYGVALRDRAFMFFLAASALMVLVYIQMNTSLAVYLRDQHGVDERGFSYILSLNAGMVVLFQFGISRWLTRYKALAVMAAGSLLYAVGFALYGFVTAFWLFLFAMVIITIGEMLVSPVGQAIVARLAPEAMRGRYMAVFGLSWVAPVAVGPLAAGLVLDNLNPNLLWYGAGALGLLAAIGFWWMDRQVDRAAWGAVDRRLQVIEQLESGLIDAAAAGRQLAHIHEGEWSRLAPTGQASAGRRMRIRVTDMATGVMKVDLHLPVGLVTTVLVMGGRLAAELDPYDSARMRALVEAGAQQGGTHQLDAGGERLEVDVD